MAWHLEVSEDHDTAQRARMCRQQMDDFEDKPCPHCGKVIVINHKPGGITFICGQCELWTDTEFFQLAQSSELVQ